MNKLLLIGLVAITCLMYVKGDEKFQKEWKEYMNKSFCKSDASAEEKDKFIECAEHTPEEIKEIIFQKTQSSAMREAALKMCEDEASVLEVTNAIKESGATMTEADMNAMMECKDS